MAASCKHCQLHFHPSFYAPYATQQPVVWRFLYVCDAWNGVRRSTLGGTSHPMVGHCVAVHTSQPPSNIMYTCRETAK